MKITEAGKLYLKDYHILNEARKEMVEYLNAVLKEVEVKLEEKKSEYSCDKYLWNVWRNKTTEGELSFRLVPKSEIHNFRKNQPDIFIKIYDIRFASDLANPYSIKKRVETHKNRKEVWKLLGQKHNRYSFHHYLIDQSISLEMISSDKDADLIFDSIIEEVYAINEVIDGLI